MGEGSSVAVSCYVGHRCGSDPALLRLWLQPVSVGPIGPLAWDFPYTAGVALNIKNQTKPNQTKRKQKGYILFSLYAPCKLTWNLGFWTQPTEEYNAYSVFIGT